ncbi:hypothetical protein QBC37DRAFT_442327 [Rhypophila decipiens]|uniref:Amidoligase enzyme n=1 Tax=Rhypophila decipiens TaxID=261697 RepID=A0AAN7B5R5_9PEZI|nr:hypothetical protein QBC37DRAFT_442327 [Rhypophila decipiens]
MASSSRKAHGSFPVPKRDNIAFGLELKCLIPLLAPGAPDPQPDYTVKRSKDGKPCKVKPLEVEREIAGNNDAIQKRAHRKVAEVISRFTGCEAISTHEIAQINQKESNYWETHWIVKKANSAEPTAQQGALKGYTWVPVEISSPKLSSNDPSIHGSVAAVMDALKENFRVVANYTCDIHVHVGRMDGKEFPLPAIQRLGALLWMTEPILRTIRDPHSPNYHNKYTWGSELRVRSRLAEEATYGGSSSSATSSSSAAEDDAMLRRLLQLDPTNPHKTKANSPIDLAALSLIARTDNHTSLGQLLSGEEPQYRRLGFNFSAFGKEDKRAKTNPRTVEFRIMEGTMDVGCVISWLRICKAVTAVAVDDSLAPYYRQLMKHLLKEGHHYGLRDQDGKLHAYDCEGERAGQQFATLMGELGLSSQDFEVLWKKVVKDNEKKIKQDAKSGKK